jgi:hypothetical protein
LPKAKNKERYLLKARTEKQQLSKAKKNELFYLPKARKEESCTGQRQELKELTHVKPNSKNPNPKSKSNPRSSA